MVRWVEALISPTISADTGADYVISFGGPKIIFVDDKTRVYIIECIDTNNFSLVRFIPCQLE